MSIENKKAIVTGAASGIGRATAIELSKAGAKVVVSDINQAGGEETVGEIVGQGGIAVFQKTDVSKLSDIKALIKSCVDNYGGIDIMINNAGIGGPLAFFDQITEEEWHQLIAINQTGVFFCMREVLPIMKAQRGGIIVNTSSVAGIGSAARMGAYAATKHAVIGMTKTAAVEYAKYGIRINAVCPTVIKTPMGDNYINDDSVALEFVKSAIPMKRFGEALEVAQTIKWLCSESSSYITGQAIRIDGGMRA